MIQEPHGLIDELDAVLMPRFVIIQGIYLVIHGSYQPHKNTDTFGQRSSSMLGFAHLFEEGQCLQSKLCDLDCIVRFAVYWHSRCFNKQA